MSGAQAIAFVRAQGVVLESARGPVRSLADHVAGETIAGGWWGHPKGREIFAVTRAVRASTEVLTCRLVNGRITYVHRRLWPALVVAGKAGRLPRDPLAWIHERHTSTGRHALETEPFPDWVPRDVQSAANAMDLEAALAALGLTVPKSRIACETRRLV